MLPELAVVVPVYNSERTLKKCLNALIRQDAPHNKYCVIVVDDGSSDLSPDIISRFLHAYPQIIGHIRHEQNLGLSAARNSGWKCAKSRIILFLDSDLVASPCLVSEHLVAHKEHPQEEQAVLGHVAFPKDVPRTPLKDFGNQVVRMWDTIKSKEEKLFDWTYFFGGQISLKRSILEKCGGFDDIIFKGSNGFEDWELGYRLWKGYGLKIVYVPRGVAYHYHWREPKDVLEGAQIYGETLARWLNKKPELEMQLLPNLSWLEFLQRDPPFRVWFRERIRKILINSNTVPIMLSLAGWLKPRWEKGAAAIYWKTQRHFTLMGFEEGRKAVRS